jgi:Zn-dependent peptidase ImmA (M78 family)
MLLVALKNRHPVDILRTVAHELVHYKQDQQGELTDTSGETGSPHENQAHEIAGVIMRNFNKHYPEYLRSKPL